MKYIIPLTALLLFTVITFAQEEPAEPEKPEVPGAAEPAGPVPLNLSPAQISREVELLGSRFFSDRTKAHENLTRAGETAVPYLKEIIDTDNILLRAVVVELLATLKQREIIPTLLEMLKDHSPVIKRSGIKAFELYGAELLPEVKEMIKSGKLDPKSLPDKLVASLYKSAVLALFEKAGQGQYPGQYEEVVRLGPKAVPAIIELLEEALKQQMSRENLQVSGRRIVQIINAAAEIKDKRLCARLEKMIQETNITPSFRQLLALSLAKQGVDTYYKQILDNMLREADEKAGDSTFCFQLAQMYHRVGKHDEAAKWFDKCVQIARTGDQSTGIPYYNLACALAMAKKLDKAADALKKSIEGGYKDFDWLVKDRELDSIRTHPEYIKLLKKHSPKHLPKETGDKQDNGEKEKPPEETEKKEEKSEDF